MFSHIRTSKENKEVVTQLTNKLNLGAENVIARIALAHSLKRGQKLSLEKIQNSGGKEYTRAVLLGEFDEIYVGMICAMYGLYNNDKDIPKYLKAHLDDGLGALIHEFPNSNELIQIISDHLK
jgi:DNA sulfur modification protein DndE